MQLLIIILCVSKDPRDYGWKEHEAKFIPTLKKIETLEKTNTRYISLKKGDEYAETREDDDGNIYEFHSNYSKDDHC